jgi:hypothetical protein
LQTLRSFMREYQFLFSDPYTASGHIELKPWEDPVRSQRFMFSESHLELLYRETGIQPWQFEQHVGEGVFIPAGCAHQARLAMSALQLRTGQCNVDSKNVSVMNNVSCCVR